MNFHKLSIITNKTIKDVRSYQFRQTVLAIFDGVDSVFESKLNFHLSEEKYNLPSISKIPYVLFGFPYKNCFTLYTYNDDIDLLRYVAKNFPKKFYVNKEHFEVIDTKVESIQIIPIQEPMIYKTLSPILLFTGNRRKWLDAVLAKEQIERRDDVLKEKIQKLLIENVRYQTQQLLKNKHYKQFDKIKICWNEFKLIRIDVRGKKEYGIVGIFTSNYRLPQFLGHKIGFGYGEIASC